jgi:hypothetical protein
MSEKLLRNATNLFVGKTIEKMDARACNNVEFLFTDGSKVALHIDCNSSGFPVVVACTSCCDIKPNKRQSAARVSPPDAKEGL